MKRVSLVTRWLRASRIIVPSLLFCAGVFAIATVPSFAGGVPQQSQERYLEIVAVRGTVTYENESLKAEGRPAKVGDRLTRSGEGISTASNSGVRLAVDTGIGTVDVAQNSNLQVNSLRTLRNGAKTTELGTNKGQVRSRVRTLNNRRSRFSIQTPTGVAGVRGTEFVVNVLPNGETRVYTVSGRVAVSGRNRTREVSDGYYSVILPRMLPTAPRLTSEVTPEELPIFLKPDYEEIPETPEEMPLPDRHNSEDPPEAT